MEQFVGNKGRGKSPCLRLQKLCTYKHIRSSENAVFTGLFTTFLV